MDIWRLLWPSSNSMYFHGVCLLNLCLPELGHHEVFLEPALGLTIHKKILKFLIGFYQLCCQQLSWVECVLHDSSSPSLSSTVSRGSSWASFSVFSDLELLAIKPKNLQFPGQTPCIFTFNLPLSFCIIFAKRNLQEQTSVSQIKLICKRIPWVFESLYE